MSETPRTCRRCGEEARPDWSYCPHCALILSEPSPAGQTLSDRIRYVRRDSAPSGARHGLTRSLANLSFAVAILLMLGGGIVLFHPEMVPSLFRAKDLSIPLAIERVTAPEPTPPENEPWVGIEWKTIPAGEYQYGPTGNAEPVWMGPFQIMKYEVTNWQWREYLAHEKPRLVLEGRWEESIPRHWGVEDTADPWPANEIFDHPVVNITWYQAQDFCVNYLAGKAGFEGARLPTPYEWEKAARGSEDDRPWPWGSEYFIEVDAGGTFPRANTKEMAHGVPQRVNAYMRDKSPFGVIGMAGNVGEFVGIPSRNYLAWMGGTYYTDRLDAKIYIETPIAPGAEHCWAYVGFRAARGLDEGETGDAATEGPAPVEENGEAEGDR